MMEALILSVALALAMVLIAFVVTRHYHHWEKWSAPKQGTDMVIYNPSYPSLRSEESGAWNYQERYCATCGAMQTRTIQNAR